MAKKVAQAIQRIHTEEKNPLKIIIIIDMVRYDMIYPYTCCMYVYNVRGLWMPTTHVLGTMVPLTQCGLTCLRRWKCNAAFSRDLAKARHERVSLNSRCRGSCCCYIDKMPLRSPFCLTNLYGCHFSFSLCSSRKSNALRLSSGECHIHLLTFDS